MRTNRTVVILVTVAALAAGTAAAQRGTRLGLAAGVNFAKLSGDDVDDADMKAGFVGGGFASFDLSPTFSIESGVYYSQRGAKASESGVSATVKLDYIEIPLLAVLRFPGSSRVTPFIGAGGAVAFRTGCGFTVAGGGASISGGCDAAEDELEGRFESTDLGVVGQAGVDIGDIRIAVRYNHGLTSLIDTEGIVSPIRHQTISLLAGYAFRLN